ncbi:MAG: hypothetical protein OEV33_00270 [Armatimonadota bacterium]|nr:hypothetical protein [Armatimonadota bacterium]
MKGDNIMNGDERQDVVARPTDPQTQLLAEGHTIMRLENDTQMAVAIQRPRDERKILEAALAELDTYPSAASEAIYCKPTGRLAKCPACGTDTRYQQTCPNPKCGKLVPETYAENLSIRTAESLANRWGNNAYGVEYAEENGDFGIVSAVFLDYETNNRRIMQRRVSKFYKKRGSSQVVQMTPDKFDLKVAADGSKVLREVILRSLPSGLKREYYLKAYSMLSKGGDVKARTERMLAAFSRFGVTMEMLESLAGKSLSEFSNDDVTTMIGVHNTIRDGDSTVGDIFGDGKPKSEDQPGLHVTSGAPTVENPPHRGEPKAEPKPEAAVPPPPTPEPPAEQSATVAYVCQECGVRFEEPGVFHKGKNKGRQHCPEPKCCSIKIARVEETPPPEPDPSIVEDDETPPEPEDADPTEPPKPPGEAATEPSAGVGASPAAASAGGREPLLYCLEDRYCFLLSEAEPKEGTQFGACPRCHSTKLAAVHETDELRCRRGHTFPASKRTKSGKCPKCLSPDLSR